ncbi:MAG: tRNA epoxyqueuosine(34) reductase QueG [Pirellulaceae bacterium]|nr:tRNA epoxyqueuosine(34) reductase QueG [Pirellulaceae bacterium]
MLPDELTTRLKQEARRLGFDLVGATAAVEPAGFDRLREWLAEGRAGQMSYLSDHAEAQRHPRNVLDGARSLLMLAVGYRTVEPASDERATAAGRIARYAWGRDYHDVVRERLHALADLHRRLTPGASVRGVVDTAPLLEREFAQRAGLGWIGKNTMLINRDWGSWVFLASLLTSEELTYDVPREESPCGSCRACLDACPSGALAEPYRLDARRCVSYLTIELRDSIDQPLREAMGDRLFGCDACQEACPWNRRTAVSEDEAFRPREGENPADPIELLSLDEEAFRGRFRDTPLWRARRGGLLRNAAIVLGNRRAASPEAMAALRRGANDDDFLIREACEWALVRCEAAE